jgi:hypothetical protein
LFAIEIMDANILAAIILAFDQHLLLLTFKSKVKYNL